MCARVNVVIGLAVLCGCGKSNDQPPPGAKNDPKGGKVAIPGRPFMEHPSGNFATAVDAMADAIKRLRAQPQWDDWITFCAQGMGPRVDTYHFAQIHMRKDEFKLHDPIDVDIELVTRRAGVPRSSLSKSGDVYSVGKTTPLEAARIMDVIFRHYLGIRPHAGEGDDYAVGAEW
jgi:hypothetical protein